MGLLHLTSPPPLDYIRPHLLPPPLQLPSPPYPSPTITANTHPYTSLPTPLRNTGFKHNLYSPLRLHIFFNVK